MAPPLQEAETICVNDQGGKRIDFSIGISGTLCTRGHRPLVSVYENHGIDARYNRPPCRRPDRDCQVWDRREQHPAGGAGGILHCRERHRPPAAVDPAFDRTGM